MERVMALSERERPEEKPQSPPMVDLFKEIDTWFPKGIKVTYLVVYPDSVLAFWNEDGLTQGETGEGRTFTEQWEDLRHRIAARFLGA